MKHWLKLCIISLIAIVVHGYQYGTSDQEIFIPYILKSTNKALFSGDALFNQNSAHLSFFYPAVGLLVKFIDIQIVFFVGYLIFQVIFLACIYRLAKFLLKDKRLAYFSLLPFILPKFIGGSATQTFDTFFGYRTVGIIFVIFYLGYLIKKKYLNALIIATAGALFHPLSIIPSIFTLPVMLMSNSKAKYKDSLKIIGVSTLLVALLYFVLNRSFFDQLLIKDETWRSIIKIRDGYIFVSTWRGQGWAAFFLYPTLIILFITKLHKDIRKSILTISSVSLILFLVNAYIVEILKFPGFTQFQLVRAVAPIAYIGLTLSPLLLKFKNKTVNITGTVAFLFLCLNLFYYFLVMIAIFLICRLLIKDERQSKFSRYSFIFTLFVIVLIYLCLNYKSYSSFQNKIQFPKIEDDWINLQKWVNKNTNVSEKFMVPPDKTGFRIFSQRSIVGDLKDGAVVVYSQEYANYWFNLTQSTRDYKKLNDQDFFTLKQKYNFNFIVTTNKQKLDSEIIYKNKLYTLYKM